ncbi:MAG: UDP-glucose 4-epimerase GalE [Pelagibacterales bacterium]|nr:UDP-glucose 4-epimerase GalE [Pelagibacterales bacterium]|tara:strand:- start:10986 stop:11996 length:1011 start_codon:yes stop_codon:yes gene_type:complete
MRAKILVTGGAGYIGSHTVVELFLCGYMPIIVDNLSNSSETNISGINQILNTNIPFHKIDCTDFEQMENLFKFYDDIYACIHFAAFKSVGESIANPKKYYTNNIGSLEVILKCLNKNKFKNLIFSSSCTVYGMPDKLPINELAPFKKAESPYGQTKQKCEVLIKENICNSVSLRYFNPIGSHASVMIGDCSHDGVDNLVPIVTEVASGIREKLIINGNDYNTHDGTCVRDYIHVQDLASAHVSALDYLLKNKVKEVFNVGTGKGLSVLDIINIFEEVNNLKVNYTIGARREGDIDKIYSDGNKIKNFLDWQPNRTIKEALISAWTWQASKNMINKK